ncbi:hypothetical protein ACFWIB_31815 [Streptomyces sp. NPDC127051]|uniref:hypothetical protein n=1 Tax=Streptomyces sp. NPDC127051 TaxID=3347119 RepID=UPI0036687869
MSGATGAGPAKTGEDGTRGPAADSPDGGAEVVEVKGRTVTDTRKPKQEKAAPAPAPAAPAAAPAGRCVL